MTVGSLKSKAYYFISFFTFVGYYAGLELIIFLGLGNLTRFYSVPLRLVVSLVMIVFLLTNIKRVSQSSLLIYFLFSFFWIFYVFAIVREIYNPSPELIFSPYTYLGYSLIYCIIPFLFYSLKHSWSSLEIFKSAIIFSGIVLSILTFALYGQFLLSGIGRINELKYLDGGSTSFISPLALSYSSSIVISICLYYILFRKIDRKTRTYYWIATLLSLIPFFLGASRGSVIVILFSLFVVIMLQGAFYTKISAIVMFSVIAVIVIVFANMTGSNVVSGILNLSQDMESNPSNVIRLSQWNSAISQFLSSPVLGDSIQSEVPPYPHNVILEVFMSVGVIGALPFLSLLAFAFYKSLTVIRYRPEYTWISIIYFQGLIQGMVSGAVYSSIFLWSGIGLLVSINAYPRRIG